MKNDVPLQHGTGFYYATEVAPGQQLVSIYTNKHVLEGADAVLIDCHIGQNVSGVVELSSRKKTYKLTLEDIFQHPDPGIDLASFSVTTMLRHSDAEGETLFIKTVSSELIPTSEEWSELDAVEEILMVGCPNGLFDLTNKIPIVRRGITGTPASVNYCGKREFMVDIACFPGSSGSPIFLFNPFGRFDKKNGVYNIGNGQIKLIGVLHAGPQYEQEGSIELSRTPIAKIRSMLHLGFALRSDCILEVEALHLQAHAQAVASLN